VGRRMKRLIIFLLLLSGCAVNTSRNVANCTECYPEEKCLQRMSSVMDVVTVETICTTDYDFFESQNWTKVENAVSFCKDYCPGGKKDEVLK
jgi:hypothetical protein